MLPISRHLDVSGEFPIVVWVSVWVIMRKDLLEQGKRSTLPFSGTKAQCETDLSGGSGRARVSEMIDLKDQTAGCDMGLTYLRRGKRLKAQTIALIPPITSSLSGGGPVVLHRVVST